LSRAQPTGADGSASLSLLSPGAYEITIPDRTTFGAMADAAHELRAWLAPTRVTMTYGDFAPDLTITEPKAIRRLTRLVGELLLFARSRR